MHDIKFLKAFFKNWKEVGAFAPTSRFVAKRMVRNVDFEKAGLLVELGAGMGKPITRELLARMRPDARLVAFEVNADFCEELRRIGDPRLSVVNASAEMLAERLGGARPDHVISSIPLTTLPSEVRDSVLRQAKSVLREGGLYIQVQYSPASYRALKGMFRDVSKAVEGLNLPPAIIYECRP